jgi:hypothetical protein
MREIVALVLALLAVMVLVVVWIIDGRQQTADAKARDRKTQLRLPPDCDMGGFGNQIQSLAPMPEREEIGMFLLNESEERPYPLTEKETRLP